MVDWVDSHGSENMTQTLALLTRSGSLFFDPIIMVKDGIEQSGLRGEGSSSRLSLNLYAIVFSENRREDGTGGEKRAVVVCFFQSSRHVKRRGIGRE